MKQILFGLAFCVAVVLSLADEKSEWETLQAQLQAAGDVGNLDGDKALAKLMENFMAVVSAAEEFSRKYPKNPQALDAKFIAAMAYWQLAQQAVESGKPPAAALNEITRITGEILAAKPSNELAARTMLFRIISFGQQGSASLAIDEAEAFLKRFPKHERAAETQLFIAEATFRDGLFDRARAAAKAVAKNYPSAPESAVAKAMLTRLDLLGKPLEDLQFTALDGRRVDIKDHRGKVVLVDFWASWCGPCMAEMPLLRQLYEEYHPRGMEIIGISLDDSRVALSATLTEFKILWPQSFEGKSFEKNPFTQRFGIVALPSNYLVDQKGNVAKIDLRGKSLAKAIEELLPTPKGEKK